MIEEMKSYFRENPVISTIGSVAFVVALSHYFDRRQTKRFIADTDRYFSRNTVGYTDFEDEEFHQEAPDEDVEDGEEPWDYIKFASEQRLIPAVKSREMTEEQVDQFLDIGMYGKSLARHQKNLNQRQLDGLLDLAFISWDDEFAESHNANYTILNEIIDYQTLYPQHMERIVLFGRKIPRLIEKHNLPGNLMDYIIDNIYTFYKHQEVMDALFKKQRLSAKQIEKIIENGYATRNMFREMNISDELTRKFIVSYMEKRDDWVVNFIPDMEGDVSFLSDNNVMFIMENMNPEDAESLDVLKNIVDDMPKVKPEFAIAVLEYIDLDGISDRIDDYGKNDVDNHRWSVLSALMSKDGIPSLLIDKVISLKKDVVDVFVNTYTHQILTENQVSKAIDRGIYLQLVSASQNITADQIDTLMMLPHEELADVLHGIVTQETLTDKQLEEILNLPKKLPDGSHLLRRRTMVELYGNKKLNEDQVVFVANNKIYFKELLRQQKVSPDMIEVMWEAVKSKDDKKLLIEYQDVPAKLLKELIESKDFLATIYKSPNISPEMRSNVLQGLGFRKNQLTNIEYVTPEILKFIGFDEVSQFLSLMNSAVKNKVPENPLSVLVDDDTLTRNYEIRPKAWEDIVDFLRVYRNGYFVKEGDTKWAYYRRMKNKKVGDEIVKVEIEDRSKISRLIIDAKKGGNWGFDMDKIEKDYNRICSLGIPKGELHLMISMMPGHIAMKSSGWGAHSCESLDDEFGGIHDEGCGWCDDVSNNNAIAVLVDSNTGKWLMRRMIRWCNRSDDDSLDAVIENYYCTGDGGKFSTIMKDKLQQVMRDAGFSGNEGRHGDVKCWHPYGYSGWVDSSADGHSTGHDDGIPYKVLKNRGV